MGWLDRIDALSVQLERKNLTRRQALQGLAAGAVVAAPASGLLSEAARGAGCLRVEPACLRDAEGALAAALDRCARSAEAGGMWSELRCRVRAQSQLTAARQACRRPDDALCAPGERCDGTTGGCVPNAPAPPPAEDTGPVGTGPCANDWPTPASLAAARTAIAAGAAVVDLSPGGCMRLERTFADDGSVATERTLVGGTIVAEYVFTATGMTGRRDDDRDGYFEYRFEQGDGTAEMVHRDPATKAVTRRETRTVEADHVLVVIEEDGEVTQQFKAGADGVSLAGVDLPWENPEFCGQERDAYYGRLMMIAIQRVTKCLEARGLGDVANEMLYAGTHATLLCDSISGAYAAAVDAGDGARSGRIVLNPEAMDTRLENDQIQTLAHELLHYTSLGLHDSAHTGNDDSRMEEGDRVYACAILCADGATSAPNKCHCATCLGTSICDERCKRELECKNPDLGSICPCLARNKWYPTEIECAEDCSSGLLCFGFSKCKTLSRGC